MSLPESRHIFISPGIALPACLPLCPLQHSLRPTLSGTVRDGLGRSWDGCKSENPPCLPALGRWEGCTPPRHPPPSRLIANRGRLEQSQAGVGTKTTPFGSNPGQILPWDANLSPACRPTIPLI